MDLNKKQSISRLENLPNEIFYIIFQYFDLGQLYRSIFGLNVRLTELSKSSSHRLSLDGKASSNALKIFASHIRSIYIKDHHNFISLAPVCNSLSVLTLQRLTKKYLNELPRLVHLQHLTVENLPTFVLACRLSKYVSSATQLHHLNLPHWFFELSGDVYPSLRSHRASRYVRHYVLTNVLRYVPNLTYLHYKDPYNEELTAIDRQSVTTYPGITTFRLEFSNSFTRSQLEFYLALTPQIKSFHISVSSCIFYNSQNGPYEILNIIANIIEKRLLNLEKFRCSAMFFMLSKEPFDITLIHSIYHQKNVARLANETQLFRSYWVKN